MPEHAPRTFSSTFVVIACASVLAVAAIGWAIYVIGIRHPTESYLAATNAMNLKSIGLTSPVVNHLDSAFADADGDLTADPPRDPSKLLDPDPLVFSFVATEDPEPFREAFKELCDHLAHDTGKTVRYELINNTSDELKAMRDGKLQIAGFSTGAVPAAVDLSGFVPICMLGNGTSGGYRMQIIVPADSDIQAVEDLKGRELALTEPTSNSGFKAPLVILSKDHGLLPGRDFGIRYTGGQEESIRGIGSKMYDAAAVADDVLNRAIAAGAIKKTDCRVVLTSDVFPTAAIGYAYNLKPPLAAKIKASLIGFDWKGTGLEKQFGPSGDSNFVPTDFKKDWAIVRQIDDAIGSRYSIK